MAVQEIRVQRIDGQDADGGALKEQLFRWGIGQVTDVTTSTVYRFEGITESETHRLASELTDPVTQRATVNVPIYDGSTLEIGYKPGVMNPVEASLLLCAQTLGIHPAGASSSTEFYFQGNVRHEELARIGEKLTNQVKTVIWEKPETLIVAGAGGGTKRIPVRGLTGAGLEELSRARRLFLSGNEMRVIRKFYRDAGREPTDVELEMLAQTWSEHCSHKTFKAPLFDVLGQPKESLMARIRKTSEQYFDAVGVVSAFRDNAGGIGFYEGEVIIAKGETHNSPVAIEPYGGALTKNGGVYRDIAGFGLGGRNLVGIMVNCFGPPDMNAQDIPENSLHPKILLKENFYGERDYGNQMGIPTHATALHFHPDFGPKPTSMGIVVGIIPERFSQKGEPLPGDYVVTIGGATGRDGIHGATFSSGAMTEKTSVIDATAVQIGNAIEEKRMFDAIISARDAGLIRAITDCGAGGYSSAVGEIAQNAGAHIELDRIPLKYSGLAPWEIWLSESQERMVLAIAPENWQEFERICDAYEVPATVFGEFSGDGRLSITSGAETVGELPMEFLHHGLPEAALSVNYRDREEHAGAPSVPTDWADILMRVLGHPNVASTEVMLRQFDTTVQGTTVLHPFGGVYQDAPNDASVIAPLYGKPYGVVTAHALNPLLNRLDPYRGSQWAVAMAASRYAAVGGNIREAALIDNFVWPKPDPEFLGDLDRSVDGLCAMMDVLHIPCVSGKDSLASTYKTDSMEINIPPVLNITVFGRIPEVRKTVSSDIKHTDSTLVLVGTPDVENLGGSMYFQTQDTENTHVSAVNIRELPAVLQSIHDAIGTGRVNACKAVGVGGLATTIAQMCFGGDCGAVIDVGALGASRADFALFNETAGTFVVEVASEELAHGLFGTVAHAVVGKTTEGKTIRVHDGETEIFSADLYRLKHAWQQPLKEILS